MAEGYLSCRRLLSPSATPRSCSPESRLAFHVTVHLGTGRSRMLT